MRRILAAATMAAVTAFAGTAASADNGGLWAGPYRGWFYGRMSGNAGFEILPGGEGLYGAPGDTFDVPLGMPHVNFWDIFEVAAVGPVGFTLGYNWQQGRVVYGVEAVMYTPGGKADNFVSPTCSVLVTRCEFDVKGHWHPNLTARIGLALGPVLFYVQGGLAIGHIVAGADVLDPPGNPGWHETSWFHGMTAGAVAGGGVDVMLPGGRSSIGFSYLATTLAARTVDDAVDDYRVQFSNQIFVVRYTRMYGNIERRWNAGEERDIGGFYVGRYAGALHQLGFQSGYDFLLRDRILAGVSLQGSRNICCTDDFGPDYEVDVNARVGVLIEPGLLAYGELGIGYHTGSFFDVHTGLLYNAGIGMEIALTPRMSGFMEIKATGGAGMLDGNFQAGINFRFR
ncbi:MAG: hypothetical protein KIS68_07560 [Bauldia sp.]|nr:hypothetical protein [Bauldia sp.]